MLCGSGRPEVVSAKKAAAGRNAAAEVVVAAADSLKKSGADFVADGVDDREEIQRALDVLAGRGGTVVLLAGR